MITTEYSVDKEEDGYMKLNEKSFFMQLEVYLQNSLPQGNEESNATAGLENERRSILINTNKMCNPKLLPKKKKIMKSHGSVGNSPVGLWE